MNYNKRNDVIVKAEQLDLAELPYKMNKINDRHKNDENLEAREESPVDKCFILPCPSTSTTTDSNSHKPCLIDSSSSLETFAFTISFC